MLPGTSRYCIDISIGVNIDVYSMMARLTVTLHRRFVTSSRAFALIVWCWGLVLGSGVGFWWWGLVLGSGVGIWCWVPERVPSAVWRLCTKDAVGAAEVMEAGTGSKTRINTNGAA